MTLKDLATRLNKPTKEISRILTRLGFRGIYKDSHAVPDTAIELVEVEIVKGDSVPNALPSANPESLPVSTPTASSANSTDGNQLQQVAKASVAVKTQINNQRHSQLNDDYEKVGVVDAITAQMSYRKGFDQTLQILAEMDDKAHRQMMDELQSKLNGEIDFFATQVNETYYKSLQHTETTKAKDLQDMIKNLNY